MSAHPPPVPQDQRNPHEQPGSQPASGRQSEQANRHNRNTEEQGRQGNVKQNTTNTGYQQDR
jgi:hypothetical protein